MFNHLSKTQIGMILALVGYTAFAFSDIIAKWMVQEYSTFQTIFMSNVFAAIIMLIALPRLGGVKALKNVRYKRFHLMRAALNVSISFTVVYSFTILPIADVYTFIFAMPFYAAILAIPFYKESVPLSKWISILIGFAGVILALQPGAESFDTRYFWPILSGVLIALMFILSKSMPEESLFSLGFWPVLGNVILAGAVTLYFGFEPLAFEDLLIFSIHGLFIGVGILGVSNGFRYAPAALAAPFLYTEMIWALLFGYLLFGDTPNMMMMVGATVIILSGLYLVETERRNKS